jgi:hypothetical protein
MKPSRLTTVLSSMLGQRWPAFIWGPPGVGKSAIVHSIASAAKLPVVDLRASLLDPTDLRGIPAIVDKQAVWCPPAFLPKESSAPGILFLDEINAAPPLVQASLYQLVLDRRVGEYVLPDGLLLQAIGSKIERLPSVCHRPYQIGLFIWILMLMYLTGEPGHLIKTLIHWWSHSLVIDLPCYEKILESLQLFRHLALGKLSRMCLKNLAGTRNALISYLGLLAQELLQNSVLL